MSGDDEFSDSSRFSWFGEICDDFRLPFKRLCTKEFSLSNLVNEESELYKKSIEIHRNETFEAAVKVYQDPVLLHSWDNFKHAADRLAVMHRRIKHRMNRVLSTAYESGSVAFSKDFLNEFGRILQKSNELAANRALPEGMLSPLLMAQSDPPHGAFKRRRRTLRVRRQRRSLQTKNTVTESRSSGCHPSDSVPPIPEMSRLSDSEVQADATCDIPTGQGWGVAGRRWWGGASLPFGVPTLEPKDLDGCVKMGRKKIAIKKISDEKTLLVTFAKRKVGLFNKAFELSELCECEVAILILTNKNRMHMFASHDLSSVVKQYNDRPDRGELMTSQDIIERRKKKKQSKSSQPEDRPLNQQYPSTCDCGTGEYDGGMDNESLVPTTVSSNTTAIAAPADYDDQLAQLGLPQHDVRPHLKSFYSTDGTEEDADVFQHQTNSYAQHYAAECTVEAVEPTSPLKMETDGELNTEEGTKPVLLTDLTLTGAPSISETSPKKHSRKQKKIFSLLEDNGSNLIRNLIQGGGLTFAILDRQNLGTLRTNRPPAFGDGCKFFDPTISSPLPTSKRRIPQVFRGSTTTDSELYTPEPHQKPTQVIISDNPDLYQGWSHVNAGPTSLSSSGEGGLTKSTSNVFNGTFTQLDESNQRHLITPDPEQLTAAPFTAQKRPAPEGIDEVYISALVQFNYGAIIFF
eukprot:TsM_001072000 transcript=TsM_001072000 gene=TsM_001072000